MEQNPFSLYDFMGYLFPGCLVLIIFSYFQILEDFNIHEILNFENVEKLITYCDNLKTPSCLIIIVVGYTIGHIIAYLSSIFVETIFTIRVFGYPSSYLLGTIPHTSKPSSNIYRLGNFFNLFISLKKVLRKYITYSSIIGIFTKLILLPISATLYICDKIKMNGLKQFIVRPLDKYLQNTLKEKQYRLADKLKISHPDVNFECDYHRILMHYVYINIPRSRAKTNKYLALYGFLRSLTLIACVTFDIIFFVYVKSIDLSASIDIKIISCCAFLFIVAFFLYLAFLKFYRRFTLENMMCMLVGMHEDENNSMSHVYHE